MVPCPVLHDEEIWAKAVAAVERKIPRYDNPTLPINVGLRNPELSHEEAVAVVVQRKHAAVLSRYKLYKALEDMKESE